MNSDFKEFQEIEPISPPKYLSEAILSHVRTELNPSALKVFGKLSSIHFFVAALTLSVCPQFGFKFFNDSPGLMGYFMNLGHFGCFVACGSFFMGSSVLISVFLMKADEVRTIRRNWLTQFTCLALLSLGFFIMLDTEILAVYALFWMLGSVGGAFVVTEVAWAFRRKLLAS